MQDALHATEEHTGLVEMSTDECWERLEQGSVGRIAVVDGSTPDIFPINYVARDGQIVIRTEGGTKLAAATMMSSVAFEIDGLHPETRSGWSVVVKGHGHEPKTVEDILGLEELDLTPWVDAPRSRWLVITPYEVTGRRIE